MAIKGLTDTASVAPRWSRLGKLRKGAAKPEKGPGRELPYWRFTAEGRNAAAIEQAFTSKFGKEPVAVEVFLMAATPDDAFPSWMEFWKQSSLERRCDGETCHLRRVGAQMVRQPVACICAQEMAKAPNSKPNCVKVGRLSVVIPALIEAGFIGEVVVETHSGDDLRTLAARLSVVYQTALQYGGDLRGVPFVLSREPVSMSTPRDNGERVKATKYQVRLEPAQAWTARALEQTRSASLALASGERVALAAPASAAALPAPRTIDLATGEIDPEASVRSEINFGEYGDVDMGQPPVVEAKPVAPKTATVTPAAEATPPAAKLTLGQAYDQLVAKAKALSVVVPAIPDRKGETVRAAYAKLEKLVLARATKVCMDGGLDVMQFDDPALIDQAVKIAAGR